MLTFVSAKLRKRGAAEIGQQPLSLIPSNSPGSGNDDQENKENENYPNRRESIPEASYAAHSLTSLK
jgi:hypothetical protein